jgi:Cft2 family RNA processing exonuclease
VGEPLEEPARRQIRCSLPLTPGDTIIPPVESRGHFTVRFLGGAEGIGASCALLELDGARLCIDCGVRLQGPLAERLPELGSLDETGGPQAILVTHAHLDHIGALPVLARHFPAAPIYATPPTIALMRIQLLDALKIMEAGAEGEVPLYSKAEVESLLRRTAPVKPYTPFQPVPGGPRAVYFLAGHILGAAAIGLEGPSGRVLFTGDISTGNQRTIPGMGPPRFRPDLVVSESTYGSRTHADRAGEEARLVEMVGETVAGRGKVLIPAFAIGRAQEVILILIQAMLTRRLPPFPVHVDGLVRNVCQVYRDFPAYLQPRLKRRIERFGDPFFDILPNVRPVAGERRRQAILEGPPCAVVASSGMLTGGASPIYARELLAGPENLIAITGYQDEESPGRRMLEAAEGRASTLVIDGREVPVRCRVEKYALSAHADGGQIARLLAALAPADTVLIHGSPEARGELAELLAREGLGRVHLPVERATYHFVLGEGMAGPAVDRAARPAPSPRAVEPRAAAPSRPALAPPPRRMEIERACAHIQEAFKGQGPKPLWVGLHPRKEGPVIRLNFISPEVGARYRPLLERLESETGWPIRLGPAADREAICEAALALFAAEGVRRAPRLLKGEQAVLVELDRPAPSEEEIRARFRELTGYELRIRSKRAARGP